MKTLAFLAWTALCPLTLLGCATLPKTAIVDGQEVPRKTLEFTGSPYSITHRAAHPRPGGPSSGLRDAGGNITGMVCGMDVDYSVRHEGDQVVMVGFLDQTQPTQLSVVGLHTGLPVTIAQSELARHCTHRCEVVSHCGVPARPMQSALARHCRQT